MSLYEPICAACDEDGIITLATEERFGIWLCASCATAEDEAAYERMLADYYGGASAQTVNEQSQAAHRDRAELRRKD